MFSFKNRTRQDNSRPYNIGDRLGQIIIMPYPKINFVEVDELSTSDRGEAGHGSTGR